jgi:hypothetical protein
VGRWRRWAGSLAAALLVAAAGEPESGPPPAQEEPRPTGPALMEKMVAALGGRERLDQVTASVRRGTIETVNGGDEAPAEEQAAGKIVVYTAEPGKMYSRIERPPLGVVESGLRDDVAWEHTEVFGPRLLEGAERALLLRENDATPFTDWREHYDKVEYLREETIAGHACYVLEVTPPPEEGRPFTLGLDQDSYVPRRMTMTLEGPAGEYSVSSLLEEYREIDGILSPTRIRQFLNGETVVVTIEHIEYNVDIPESVFELPGPVAALLEAVNGEDPAGEDEPPPDETASESPAAS